MHPSPLTVSTPGRICLFGEHQDYLGLPVIAAAISRRVQISATATPDKQVRLELPDIGAEDVFDLTDSPLVYQHDRDYFRSAINVLRREGFSFSRGIQGEIHGNIPINAGTSSSSALLISWLNVLTRLADQPEQLPATRLAELAYVAEVLEFGEPGGMMDHYSTAVGNLIYLNSQPSIQLQSLRPALGSFVLGDSSEPKDTIGILGRVKGGMLRIMERLNAEIPAFSLHTTTAEEVAPFRHLFTADEFTLLLGNIDNRDILREALTIVQAPELNHKAFGRLLYRHQTNLREAQRISTPKIDRMLDAALEAGAYGGKINGSGGGGCMFAYAPEQPDKVAEAIERAGGKAYVIHVDEGTRQETVPAFVTN
ncbi:mevalonate kinase family protein [Arsenicibacter rosenii]|uniref:GHMP kinase n=1 Tax=Arsenicibacter rosenii TaxID=1750698 RepID=A0A1S2VL71_9BACT|nr:galactokinase family protein [Arsenicibacter rosenii]OIN59511.1 GHMP kinase [Arsenicibacter rosenii]